VGETLDRGGVGEATELVGEATEPVGEVTEPV
jgi:hypothetical protein